MAGAVMRNATDGERPIGIGVGLDAPGIDQAGCDIGRRTEKRASVFCEYFFDQALLDKLTRRLKISISYHELLREYFSKLEPTPFPSHNYMSSCYHIFSFNWNI
jgi:hypothetical protein